MFKDQGVTGRLAKFLKPAMQIRIVEMACHNSHGKAEVSESIDTDLPVPEMTAQKQNGASGTQGPDAIVAATAPTVSAKAKSAVRE